MYHRCKPPPLAADGMMAAHRAERTVRTSLCCSRGLLPLNYEHRWTYPRAVARGHRPWSPTDLADVQWGNVVAPTLPTSLPQRTPLVLLQCPTPDPRWSPM